MPSVDGWTLLDIRRADPRFAETPTVVISGSTLATDEELAAAAVLRKPVERERLLGVVAAHCTPRQD